MTLKRLSAFSDEHKMRTCYELAEYVCGNHELPHDKKLVALCYRIYDVDRDLSKVNVAFLILLILGVVDTDSDIKNRIDNDFATMTSFAEKFFVSHSPHDDCPLLNIYAREFGLTDNHNRFYMMCLFDIILLTVSLGCNNEYEFYQSWNESKRVFDVCDCIWKDDDEDNLFYQFDYTPADYGYILTQYLIMPCSRTVKLIKYSVCFYYGDGDNRLEFFVLHPRGSYYAATGKEKVSLNEKAWLYCEVDDRIRPDNIVFTKKEKKPNFDFNAKKIVRLGEKESSSIIEFLNNDQTILIDLYEKYTARYLEGTEIYALTHENIFIRDIVNDDGFYCVPVALDERLAEIKLDDLAGLCKIGDVLYISFEPFNINYDISSDDKMHSCGIKKVVNIY